MALDVGFHPLAIDDLDAPAEFIVRDSPLRSRRFLERIEDRCRSLSTFPERGVARPDLGIGVRLLLAERRVTIAYRIDNSQVVFLRVFYAGLDYEGLLIDEPPNP